MKQPLALVYYEKLMPGSQLVNKLHDLNYRVQTAGNLASLQQSARTERPMLLLVDLAGGDAVCLAIAALKADAVTEHIPVIAFASGNAVEMSDKARRAGATLAVSGAGLASHLPELLNQALQIE